MAIALIIALVLALAAIVALLRERGARRRELDTLSHQLERERARVAELAAAEERAQIAGELHAVLARRLDAIADQAEAAELEPLRHEADEAARELRTLVSLADGETVEPPGLGDVEGLVERAREAGMPVTLLVDGTPRPLPASIEAAAFRIVQEALADVHRSAAGAPASVRVVWRRRLLGLQVRDTRASTPDDDTHVAIEERVKLHGGELRAGPLPGGGYEVTARLPL